MQAWEGLHEAPGGIDSLLSVLLVDVCVPRLWL
jgi:hypothetical protein